MVETVCLTIDWREADSELPESQQEAFTQTLYRELRSLDSVETVARVPDPAVPAGAMGGQWLWNILTAEIPGDGLRQACQEVFSRLSARQMALTVEVDGQSQKIDAKNVRPDDFDEVVDKLVEAAQKMRSAQPPAG